MIKIETAEYDGGYLKLKAPFWSVRNFLESFKANKEYEIIPHVKKRSLNANAYAWTLMRQIAETLSEQNESQRVLVSVYDVYRRMIENIGGKTSVVTMVTPAVEDFKRAFIQDHIGRNVEIIGEGNGRTDLLVTFGSSDYNVQQMSELLESIIQECELLGIPYKSESDIDKLLEDWGMRD